MVPTSAFLVRIFAIQHDCGHGSFFSQAWANNWLGRLLGVFTFTPYDDWRRAHAQHLSNKSATSPWRTPAALHKVAPPNTGPTETE